MENPTLNSLLNTASKQRRQLLDRVDTSVVWYTSYGSNSWPARLACYLDGESLLGTTHRYRAYITNDIVSTVERRVAGLRFTCRIPHRLGFAETSQIWGGGKAFVERTVEPNPDFSTLAASYALSYQQFNHVVGQENWQDPSWNEECARPIEQPVRQLTESSINGDLESRTAHTGYMSSYNCLLFLGLAESSAEGALSPVITFTRQHHLAGASDLNSPSAAYVELIATGIRHNFPGMDCGGIARYLMNGIGMSPGWKPDDLHAFLKESLKNRLTP